MPGPPPIPTALRRLQGNPGKRPLNDREPCPTVQAPTCPKWLSKAAKAEWRRIVPELLSLGLVTELDRAALAAYCVAVAELEWATAELEKAGRIVTVAVYNRNGEVSGHVQKPHPAVRLQRDAFARVKAFLAEFGLTPSSRSRLKTPQPEPEADPMTDILRRARLAH
jgi:P27 family predicted phage terminase small subunit